eukprot:3122930-Pyramimonas_sp.AAC.1
MSDERSNSWIPPSIVSSNAQSCKRAGRRGDIARGGPRVRENVFRAKGIFAKWKSSTHSLGGA